MVDRIVLVNGLPASGKSVLAAQLGAALGVPVLSKDVIKESLGAMAWPTVPSGRLGGLALDALYALAAEVPGAAVLDAVWLTGRDEGFLAAGLAVMGAPRVVEVWCAVPEAVARERFEARMPSRHPMHESWRPGFWDDAGPLHPDAIVVDTEGRVDVPGLAGRVRAAWGA